ncbi:MAG: hypothetical protein D6753_13255 [Planctomycetota bacterium]|nr:MAG: hypothetical protein D6753_13255 [Planctomycetota bacterium]
MAGDLEKFLQQAAQRLAEQARQGQAPAPKRPSPPPRQPRRNELPEEAVPRAEVVDAVVLDEQAVRRLGPDPLSEIDTRPGLAQQISQADERMAAHIHEALEHELGSSNAASRELHSRADATEDAPDVTHRRRQTSPLVEMFQQPESLRAAFIAGEVFRRKFF